MRIIPLALLAAVSLFASLAEADVVFPSDAGVIDVTQAPYNADPTGKNDATDAIQRAIDAYPGGNRIIYLPKGTYTITATLRYSKTSEGNREKRTTIHGQGVDKTILRVPDNCPAFQRKQAVIWCGHMPAQRFGNSIRFLTVHTGSGNPGARGIQYNTSNQGMIEHVAIVSGDRKGTIGLDISHTNEIGPALARHLRIEGFETGIKTGGNVNSMTFEHLTLKGQSRLGIQNHSQVITIKDLTSTNTVPVLDNGEGSAATTIIDGNFTGGDPSVYAIQNSGRLYLRNIEAPGYRGVVENNVGTEQGVDGSSVEEFSSHDAATLFQSPLRSLNLPAPNSPEHAYSPAAEWVNVKSFGAKGDGETDDTKAIQAAIDAGASTVYFPAPYRFRIDGTVRIHGGVRRIIGTRGRINGKGKLLFDVNQADTVIFERFDWGYSKKPSIDIAGTGTVVIRSCALPYIKVSGSAAVFIDDVTNHTMPKKDFPFHALLIDNPLARVWCRQFNPETRTLPKIVNNGGTLWILGLKTEQPNSILTQSNNAKCEILGAHIFAQGGTKSNPMLVNDESSLFVAGLRQYDFHNPGQHYTEIVRETQNGVTRTLNRESNGDYLTMYAGYESGAAPVRAVHHKPVLSNAPKQFAGHVNLLGRRHTFSPGRQAPSLVISHYRTRRPVRRTYWLEGSRSYPINRKGAVHE